MDKGIRVGSGRREGKGRQGLWKDPIGLDFVHFGHQEDHMGEGAGGAFFLRSGEWPHPSVTLGPCLQVQSSYHLVLASVVGPFPVWRFSQYARGEGPSPIICQLLP